MKKPSKIESDDEVNLSDSGESVVEHKNVPQPPLDFMRNIIEDNTTTIKTALSTDPFEDVIFRSCTLNEIEDDIINCVYKGDDFTHSISELKAHFERSIGYSDEHKRFIVSSLIGKMHARKAKTENVNDAWILLNKTL